MQRTQCVGYWVFWKLVALSSCTSKCVLFHLWTFLSYFGALWAWTRPHQPMKALFPNTDGWPGPLCSWRICHSHSLETTVSRKFSGTNCPCSISTQNFLSVFSLLPKQRDGFPWEVLWFLTHLQFEFGLASKQQKETSKHQQPTTFVFSVSFNFCWPNQEMVSGSFATWSSLQTTAIN